MKTLTIILIVALLFLSCKKQKTEQTEITPSVTIKYHLIYNATMGKVAVWVKGNYENGNEYYKYRSYTYPIDTIFELTQGKITKSTFELKTIYGNKDATLEVFINNQNKGIYPADSYGNILYIYKP